MGNERGNEMKYSKITVELDQHTGDFYIDIEIRDKWFTFNPEEKLVLHDELVTCRTFEFQQGIRWITNNEYEAVSMAAMVQEGFSTALKNIDTDPEFAVMQFDYITAAQHEPVLSYAGL
jgi:hypothetical protein